MHSLPFRLACLPRWAIAALMAVSASAALAQNDPGQFPKAAVRYLDAELPAMEQAVRAGDRSYFQDAMGRMLEFADVWGFKSRANPALAPHAACTGAVQDLLVVGLCKLTPNGDDCTPALSSGFERNLQACRTAAR